MRHLKFWSRMRWASPRFYGETRRSVDDGLLLLNLCQEERNTIAARLISTVFMLNSALGTLANGLLELQKLGSSQPASLFLYICAKHGQLIFVVFKCWISCGSTLMFNMLFCQDVCSASGLFPSLPLTALACLWSRYLNSWQSYKQLWPWSFCAWLWHPWEAHLRDLIRKWHKLLQCFTGRGFSIILACLLWWLAFDWQVLSPRCCTVWFVFTCFCIVSYQWST